APAHGRGQPALGGRAREVGVGPAVLVLAQSGEVLFLGDDLVGHLSVLTVMAGARTGAGMCVVHTPSPCAMVARRWTCVPITREMTRVSASHSWGNSAATSATGQWWWQSGRSRA